MTAALRKNVTVRIIKTQLCVLEGRKMKMNLYVNQTRDCWLKWAGSSRTSQNVSAAAPLTVCIMNIWNI